MSKQPSRALKKTLAHKIAIGKMTIARAARITGAKESTVKHWVSLLYHGNL